MMNSLAVLSNLKKKPDNKKNTGINVIISSDLKTNISKDVVNPETRKEEKKEVNQIQMVEQKDDGRRAKDILARLKQTRLLGVVNKAVVPNAVPNAVPVVVPNAVPNAVEQEPNEKISTKPKRAKKKLILEEELSTKEIFGDILPEGGPRLEELEQEPPGIINENVDANTKEDMNTKAKTKVKTKKGVVTVLPGEMVRVGDTTLKNRLPPPPVYTLKVSNYYMNNRETFVKFINGLFADYKADLQDESKNISCEEIGKDTGKLGLLTHQKIVRDYINLYTPYRGLLLYHGLGSGKTCSSIAIAEGLKTYRQIVVLTPASLRRNYIEEIKKCGDLLFRKNQFWEWISIEGNRDIINTLSSVLGLKVEYIERNRGAWLVNVTKPSNYSELETGDKKSLNNQLDEMIKNKYKFYNYNGFQRKNFAQLTDNYKKNIFDNSVVIIDEAHNLISRIVNKINRFNKFEEKKRTKDTEIYTHIALQLYEFLLRAENCRIILLTGTPIINYPNEIGVLFNILRGYIKTWKMQIINKETSNSAPLKLSRETVLDFFKTEKTLDYIDYDVNSSTLIVTRNPLGYQNKITESGYKGVRYDKHDLDEQGNFIAGEEGVVSDEDFIRRIVKNIRHNDFDVNSKSIEFSVNTALPDTIDGFTNNFINRDTGEVINLEKFKRRIIGLTSYFKSAQEELLPRYNKQTDKHIVRVPMSDYQFQIYEEVRHEERKTEKTKSTKQKVDDDGMFVKPTSTYKIFSRLFCNFVMPKPPGRIVPALMRKQESFKLWMDIIEERFKNNVDRRGKEIKASFDKYLATLPSDYTTNAENAKLLSSQIRDYFDKFADNSDKLVDFEVFISKDYQDMIANPENKKVVQKVVPIISKGEAKERARLEKEAAKEAALLEKAAAKQAILLEKAAAKEAALLEKAAAKQAKEAALLEKAAAKKNKGKGSEEDEEEEDDIKERIVLDISDEESDSKPPSYLRGGLGGPEDALENWVNEEQDDFPVLDMYKDEDANFRERDELEGDEVLDTVGGDEYRLAIEKALTFLRTNKEQYLNLESMQQYSPKFVKMIENIQDPDHPGLHLVYSQFRSMEGIGIFAIALEANGYARFKISRTGDSSWQLNMSEDDLGKPTYALYTGTEDGEEREIIRNIYNGDWNNIPNNIATQLRARSTNNNMGEVIKVLMITSAGSEGINLRNTRYVHVMEPYWHPVRVEQVIGRARRICSHQGLAEQYRTVEVFVYVMVFTEEQLATDGAIELKLKDTSKSPPYLPQSTDESLLEISNRKENLTSQLLVGIKEASIDCATHMRSNIRENLKCLTFNTPDAKENPFSYYPNVAQETNDREANLNREEREWKGKPIKFTSQVNGKTIVTTYILRPETNGVYDYESVTMPGSQPVLIGYLVRKGEKEYEIDFI